MGGLHSAYSVPMALLIAHYAARYELWTPIKNGRYK